MKSKPKQPSKTKPLSEAHIQRTLTDWLALDGWRCVRTDMPHLRGLGVSEPGMPDNLYIRYLQHAHIEFVTAGGSKVIAVLKPPAAEVMWIEWKKKGGQAQLNQKGWQGVEQVRGALSLIAGEDFSASIEGFCNWYAQSGLQRRKIGIPR